METLSLIQALARAAELAKKYGTRHYVWKSRNPSPYVCADYLPNKKYLHDSDYNVTSVDPYGNTEGVDALRDNE